MTVSRASGGVGPFPGPPTGSERRRVIQPLGRPVLVRSAATTYLENRQLAPGRIVPSGHELVINLSCTDEVVEGAHGEWS